MAYNNLITDLSDFREMRALYLYGAIKACHITVRYIPIEKAINSLLCWRRQHPRQTFASSLLSGDSVVLVSVQQVLKKVERTHRLLQTVQQPGFPSTVAAELHQKPFAYLLTWKTLTKSTASRTLPTFQMSSLWLKTISLGLSIFENFHDGASLMGYALCGKVKGCLTLHAERHWPFLHTLHRNVKSNPALRSVRTFINTLQGF